MTSFPEFVIGGVLVSPFVLLAALALLALRCLRPLLRALRFERWVANPPLAVLCLYTVLLALIVAAA